MHMERTSQYCMRQEAQLFLVCLLLLVLFIVCSCLFNGFVHVFVVAPVFIVYSFLLILVYSFIFFFCLFIVYH